VGQSMGIISAASVQAAIWVWVCACKYKKNANEIIINKNCWQAVKSLEDLLHMAEHRSNVDLMRRMSGELQSHFLCVSKVITLLSHSLCHFLHFHKRVLDEHTKNF
jgi:hypothetical protein